MLDAPRRVKPSAARQQRYRARVRSGRIAVTVEIDGPTIDLLVKLHWLGQADIDDRVAIGGAITRLLKGIDCDRGECPPPVRDIPRHHKLRRGPTARRQAAAYRQRRYRGRKRDCCLVVYVEIDETIIDLLTRLHWLREIDATDRLAIGRALLQVLQSAARLCVTPICAIPCHGGRP